MINKNNPSHEIYTDPNYPLVSISCITYNHEKYVADALDGFLMQKTKFPIEIIIHDDASTDRTADIIGSYEKKYPHIIKPIYQTENQYSKGVTRIMPRFTFTKARGKYIALCEGDDYWTDPYKLQKQVEYLEANPDYTICTHATKTIIFNGDNGKFEPPFSQNTKFYFEDVLQNKTSVHSVGHTSSIVFRKEVLDDLPQWFLDAPTGDVPLKMLCAIKGYGYYINENMSTYRRGVRGSWNEKVRGNNKKLIEAMKKNIPMFVSVNRYTDYKYKRIIDTIIGNYVKVIKHFSKIINEGVKWEKFILEYIKNNELENIAIFGVERAGLEIMNRLLDNNIKPKTFLDNYRFGKEISNIPIHHPEILETEKNIDLVIITVLGEHYSEVEKQISEYKSNIKLISIRNI